MATVSRRFKKTCVVMLASRWCDMKDMKVPFDSLWICDGLLAVLSSYFMKRSDDPWAACRSFDKHASQGTLPFVLADWW